jgi:hypothetical protein
MGSMVLGDSTLMSLIPSVNAPLELYIFTSGFGITQFESLIPSVNAPLEL